MRIAIVWRAVNEVPAKALAHHRARHRHLERGVAYLRRGGLVPGALVVALDRAHQRPCTSRNLQRMSQICDSIKRLISPAMVVGISQCPLVQHPCGRPNRISIYRRMVEHCDPT